MSVPTPTPEIGIGGHQLELRSLTFTIENNAPRLTRPPVLPKGQFEVSGTLVTYFTDEQVLRLLLAKPHKASAWRTLRPKLYRSLVYAALAALTSFVLISGAL